MKDITILFPHQLFEHHPAVSKGRPVALMEDSLFFGDREHGLNFHKHKLVLHRATMKMYAAQLRKRRLTVKYYEYDSRLTCKEVLTSLVKEGYDEFHCADVVDNRLRKRIRAVSKKSKVSFRFYDSPMFLTPLSWIEQFFSGQKQFRMATFYMAQRKRMNVLLDRGKPSGGKWSYDTENRKPIPEHLKLPPTPSARKSKLLREASAYVNKNFPKNPGNTDNFWFPLTFAQARSWLKDFLENRLRQFGDYEDAIVSDRVTLFHSVLTPMLNIGLLTPDEVLRSALAFGQKQKVPLNSLEGFVRQIIGWREFIRAMYELSGEEQRKGNFWAHKRSLPSSFYDGTTGVDPFDRVVQRVIEHSYCHHIERLMVLGNFMLLCRIAPDEVYRWFMELFIDAYDWVMVPNVYGMSQFADGGLFATKPYISGSNYILKMSDFQSGPWCELWNSLFWHFIDENRSFFRKQPRLSVMTQQITRMGKAKMKIHRERARKFLRELSD